MIDTLKIFFAFFLLLKNEKERKKIARDLREMHQELVGQET